MLKSFHISDNLNLSLNESGIITVFLEANNINIDYDLKDGDYKILIFNNTNADVVLNEDGQIFNSKVDITYIDLNSNDYKQNNNINVYANSSLNINSIYLGVKTKSITFNITNKDKESKVFINNNVVCLNDASFELNVIGNILKGAKRSVCRQKSQCLTFESPKVSKILPVLNIDENDVEAQHALSSGTIDEEVLFYMNSRGLSKKEALSILLVSYLLPNDDFYKDYQDGDMICGIANKKVNDLCLI